MTGLAVSFAIEAINEMEWEKLNAVNPVYEEASCSMDDAYQHLCDAMDEMYSATQVLKDTLMEDRVVSLMNSLEDIQTEIGIMRDKLRKGESE